MGISSPFKFLLSASLLLATATSQAVVTVSNLANPQGGNWIIGNGGGVALSDTPNANSFTTGAGLGWNLNNLTLLLLEDLNVSGSITVELFSDNVGVPGSSLAVLNGPDPVGSVPTPYVYTPGSTVSLNPTTTYWVVASGPVEPGFPDNYSWTNTSDTSESPALPGWSIGDTTLEAISGNSSATWGSWSPLLADVPVMFSVDVTAVPEPSTGLLLGLASLIALRRRR